MSSPVLAKSIVKKLTKKGLSLSVAESVTAGGLASELTKIAGSSKVFKGGVVAYSDEVKISELKISKAIQNLKGKVTVVIIAHRLSTVRKADNVYYLEDGKIKASGSFEEVRKISPEFDQQAKLLGL